MALLTDTLRSGTRSHHNRIEQRLGLPHSVTSQSAYRELLIGFYGFYLPVEPVLLEKLSSLSELCMSERQKLDLLRQDLMALGLATEAIEALPHCFHIPPLESVPQALGCLYVLEGSTLGGQVISAHFTRALGITAETGGQFYRGYGAATASYWRAFKEAANAYSARYPEQDSLVVESACSAFELLETWLCGSWQVQQG